MKAIALSVLCLLTAASTWAAGQKMSCSFTVTPRRGESKVSGGNGGQMLNRSSSQIGTGSKTITRNLKWQVDLRFREKKPQKLELKAYYLGYGDGGSKLKEIGKESKAIALDKDGKASLELTSPTTRFTKTKTRTTTSSGRYGSGGLSSIKTTKSGDRIAGCVIQLFADGELLKSYASDSRWAVAAGKNPFSLTELVNNSGKIGLR